MKQNTGCTQTIGIVGLGNMGGAMAANLVQNGFSVLGYDLLEQNRQKLRAAGGKCARDIPALTEECERILLSLPSAGALAEVCAELAAHPGRCASVLETSTLAIEDKQRVRDILAAGGITLLDSPISGTGRQAVHGDLALYVSGDAAAAESWRPIIDGFSRVQYYLGDFGNGTRMKFVANLLVAIHNESAAEAILLGVRSGLDAQTVYDVICESAGTSKMMETRGPMMVSRSYKPAGITQDLFQKDLRLISDALRQSGVTAPLFRACLPVYDEAIRLGRGEDDTASVYEAISHMSEQP